jgi:hypothetical protein
MAVCSRSLQQERCGTITSKIFGSEKVNSSVTGKYGLNSTASTEYGYLHSKNALIRAASGVLFLSPEE